MIVDIILLLGIMITVGVNLWCLGKAMTADSDTNGFCFVVASIASIALGLPLTFIMAGIVNSLIGG